MIQQYFNPLVFAPNADGTFGNSGRNILRGPGFFGLWGGLDNRQKVEYGTAFAEE